MDTHFGVCLELKNVTCDRNAEIISDNCIKLFITPFKTERRGCAMIASSFLV